MIAGGGYHLPAGTHAEGERRPARGQVAGQLVVGGGELVPELAELGPADRLLAVLDAHADGEALGLHGQAGLI